MLNIPRVLIAGTGSGCGKTTFTCALLWALRKVGRYPVSFKCGPDYIDPMFHAKVLDAPSYNLDLYLCGKQVKPLFAEHALNADLAVVEGVMGLYDGLGFADDRYSANAMAKELGLPTLLCVDIKGKSLSLLAEISGYLDFMENRVCGVLLNRCSKGMYPVYKQMIEKHLPVQVYGYLPPLVEASIGSRHLGLITADEITDLRKKLEILGTTALETLDIDAIVQLACQAEPLETALPEIVTVVNTPVHIAVARDEAFCFYYADALRLLERLGAVLLPFSPLQDQALPQEADALWLGGGYPEEHLKALSDNQAMRQSIRQAIADGLPTYAECGGFLYLGTGMQKDGETYPLVGAVDSTFRMTDRLVRFGYARLTAQTDNLLCQKGEMIPCHEFHYSDGDYNGNSFLAQKESGKEWACIHTTENLFAGYPHLHFWGNPHFAERLVCAAENYRNSHRKGKT